MGGEDRETGSGLIVPKDRWTGSLECAPTKAGIWSAPTDVKVEMWGGISPCYTRHRNKTFNNAVLSIDGGRPPLISEVCVGGREKVNPTIKIQ